MKDPVIKGIIILSLSPFLPPSLYLDIDPSVWFLSQLQPALVVLAQEVPDLLLVYLQVGHTDEVLLILSSINVSENVLK